MPRRPGISLFPVLAPHVAGLLPGGEDQQLGFLLCTVVSKLCPVCRALETVEAVQQPGASVLCVGSLCVGAAAQAVPEGSCGHGDTPAERCCWLSKTTASGCQRPGGTAFAPESCQGAV